MKSQEGIKQKYDHLTDKHPYVASIGEAALVLGLKVAMIKAGDKIGVPLGHGRKNDPKRLEFINEHPAIAIGLSTVVAPITEELVFREVPDRLLKKKGYDNDSKISRRAKIGNAVLFGFSPQHLGKDAIPLPQVVGGLSYNRIHRKRGLKAAVAAHMTNNAIVAAHYIAKKKRNKS